MIGASVLAQAMNSRFQRDDLLDAATKKLQEAANGKLTPEKNKQIARDFESLFLAQMLEHMYGESSGSELFGGEESQDIYKSMMVEQYGKAISARGGIGLAEYIEKSLANRALLQTQEI